MEYTIIFLIGVSVLLTIELTNIVLSYLLKLIDIVNYIIVILLGIKRREYRFSFVTGKKE